MRGTVARKLKKVAYGDDFSPRARKYSPHPGGTGAIISDRRRQDYQRLKRAYTRGDFVL